MKRSILGLMYIIQGMRHTGIDVDARLAEIGIQANALDTGSIIYPELEQDILNAIAKGVDAETGLLIGQHYALAGYGPLLMLLVTCEHIQQALESGIRFQGLTHLSGRLGLVQQDQHVVLSYQPLDLETQIGLLRAQCEVAGTYKFIVDIYKMMGLSAPDIQVYLPFKPPENIDILQQYRLYYGEDLHFDAAQAMFALDRQVLDLAIPSADPLTCRVYESKCLAELARLEEEKQQPNRLIQRVYDYLELQQGIIPSMKDTAHALNMPERTLRYQLQQQGTNYKQIREQIIKHKALKLIEYNEYSIEVISELLGYSEPASFNHAFKRWFGRSPRQYSK